MRVSLLGGRDDDDPLQKNGSRNGHFGQRHEQTEVNDPPTDVDVGNS